MNLFNWFQKQPQNNDVIQTQHVGSFSPFPSLFGLSPNNEKTISQIPSANFCMEQIVKPISQLPVYLYREQTDGKNTKIERITTEGKLKNRERVLNEEATVFHKGSDLKSHLLRQAILYGSSYAKAEWIGGDLKTKLSVLVPLDAERVIIQRELEKGYIPTTAKIVYDTTSRDDKVNTTGKPKQITFNDYDCVIVSDGAKEGLAGRGVIEKGELAFTLARTIMEFEQDYHGRGGVPFGYITVDSELGGKVGQQKIDQIIEDWHKRYSDGGIRGTTPVFNQGIKFHELTKPDISFDKKMEVVNKMIMSVFGVPYSKLNGVASKDEEATFRKNTLQPWIVKLEEALNQTLLTESEKAQGYFFRFDTSELQRASEEERTVSISEAFEKGLFNNHQVAEKLDMPKPEGPPIYSGHSGKTFYTFENGDIKILHGANEAIKTEKETTESSA